MSDLRVLEIEDYEGKLTFQVQELRHTRRMFRKDVFEWVDYPEGLPTPWGWVKLYNTTCFDNKLDAIKFIAKLSFIKKTRVVFP